MADEVSIFGEFRCPKLMNGRILNGINTKPIVRGFKTFKLGKNFRCQYLLNRMLLLSTIYKVSEHLKYVEFLLPLHVIIYISLKTVRYHCNIVHHAS